MPAIKLLLTYLVENDWESVITPASPKEMSMIDGWMKDYEKVPSTFIPLGKIK